MPDGGRPPVNDVVAAKRAGMMAIWLKNAIFSAPETSDGIIECITQLPDWLNQHHASIA